MEWVTSPWAAVTSRQACSLLDCHAWVTGDWQTQGSQDTENSQSRVPKKGYKTIFYFLLSDMDTMISQERKDEIILSTVPRTTHAMHATQYAALLVWRWEDWYLVPVGAVCGSTIRCQSAKVQRLLQPSRSPTTYWLLHALLYNCILYMYIVLLWIVAFSIYFYSTYRT